MANDTSGTYRLDRYFITGIGAVDLVLLAVLLPLGVPDRALFLAILAVAISLPFVGASLAASFIKSQFGITKYGRIHSTVIQVALASGFGALVATFWHDSWITGLVSLSLAILLYLGIANYYALLSVFTWVLPVLQAAMAPDTSPPSAKSQGPDDSEPSSSSIPE